MRKRSQLLAADLLEQGCFELRKGDNYFGDEFKVLYREASLDEYVDYEEHASSKESRAAYRTIAQTFQELEILVRFIAVDLAQDEGPEPVATPTLRITNRTVEKALEGAELMVTQGKPAKAVVHQLRTR